MLRITLFFTIVGAALACAPAAPGPVGPQPSVVTFYTDQPYVAAQSQVYTNMARSMLQQMVQRAGLPYIDSMYQITALNSNGKAAVQVRISSVDCIALPVIVTQAKASNFLIKSATYQCGNGPVTQV
ncbi:unnamed protein product [Cylicocyclus nassatus]|uniref:Uncharacterized protein n=1 Tax=Cylicocyclus nassatus TaxID=53992 RepID=A0AA36GTT6_CYLNA|nr:unnamed protein product [Cylicocyclus nassatus]